MDGVKIVFENIKRSGASIGTIRIAGDGFSSGGSGSGARRFTEHYDNLKRICTITFGGYTFEIVDKGTNLIFGSQSFSLEGDKKTARLILRNKSLLKRGGFIDQRLGLSAS